MNLFILDTMKYDVGIFILVLSGKRVILLYNTLFTHGIRNKLTLPQ